MWKREAESGETDEEERKEEENGIWEAGFCVSRVATATSMNNERVKVVIALMGIFMFQYGRRYANNKHSNKYSHIYNIYVKIFDN